MNGDSKRQATPFPPTLGGGGEQYDEIEDFLQEAMLQMSQRRGSEVWVTQRSQFTRIG
jgi:hypothetical protein